jgi:hypothetical protein
VPQERVRRLGRVVEDAGDDELFIRAQLPENARGLGAMAIVGPGRPEIADGLMHPVEHLEVRTDEESRQKQRRLEDDRAQDP